MQSHIIEERNAGQRLDKYLRKYLPEAGSGFLYKMLRKKNITLNGKKAEGAELLQTGDEIRIFFSDETFAKMRGKGEEERTVEKPMLSITVLYEDEDLLFLDKPAGLLSQSDRGGEISVNDWILQYCRKNCPDTGEDAFRPTVCNRLDRNTSGILLCAKTYAGSRFLSDLIQGHSLRKFYHAIAEGEMRGEALLEGYWSKDEKSNLVRIGKNPPKGEKAIPVKTRYKVLRCEKAYSLLEVELLTGRAHQIRAHLASVGHPLAGDRKYGGHPYHGKAVQQLRAVRLCFPKIEGAFARLSEKQIEVGGLWEER